MSAFAARKQKKNTAEPAIKHEISETARKRPGDEFTRPVKRRASAGRPELLVLPMTQNPFERRDTPIVYCVPSSNIDENKNGDFQSFKNDSLQVASVVPVGQAEDVPQVDGQDRKPASLVYQLTLYSSDSEVNVLYQGSVQPLSTFTPTKENVMGETVEEWTVRLDEADVSNYRILTITFKFNAFVEFDASWSI